VPSFSTAPENSTTEEDWVVPEPEASELVPEVVPEASELVSVETEEFVPVEASLVSAAYSVWAVWVSLPLRRSKSCMPILHICSTSRAMSAAVSILCRGIQAFLRLLRKA
jgi:hypothetical protein